MDNNEYTRELTIINRLGLHARAAARLVEVARQYQAEVALEKNGESVDAKSVISLLTLECPLGTRVVVRAKGDDSAQALSAVVDLIEHKFGEE